MSDFRYVLELRDGDIADPAMFNTALPPGMWRPGDTFLAAVRPARVPFVEIGELENPDLEDIHGVWIVEPGGAFPKLAGASLLVPPPLGEAAEEHEADQSDDQPPPEAPEDDQDDPQDDEDATETDSTASRGHKPILS